jgi:tetratricopeptide (TPR) repeat protein
VQDGISRAIASNLPIKLGRARKRTDVHPEAYDLYLRGLAAGLQDGIPLYQDAIDKDPSFALPYAALASAYAYKTSNAKSPGENVLDMQKMRAAAEKAVRLDPLLAEAHSAMGMAFARDGKWSDAEQSFRRAIELNPSRSEGYGDFSVYVLMQEGRIREALREMRIAEKSDPLSAEVRSELAYVLMSSHLYDEAAAQCERIPEDCHCWPAPRESVRYECLGRARIGQGRLQEGMQILAAGVAKGSPIGAPVRGYLAYAYGLLGRRADAQEIIEADWRNPYHQALAYIGIGDKDQAIEALRRMAASGPVRIGLALAVPELDSIRNDPRIKALRKEVGLTP